MKLPLNIPGIAIYSFVLLVSAGFAADLNKSEWAYWVGAIGTTGTLIGTIWLATDETRKRNAQDLTVARINAAAIHPRVLNMGHICQNVCKTLAEIRDSKSLPHIDGSRSKEVGRALASLELWTVEEITHLVALPGDCAEKLAGVHGMITATASLLSNTITNDRNRESAAKFISANIHTLQVSIELMASAAADMQAAYSPPIPSKQ